jgi:hypothetical protein
MIIEKIFIKSLVVVVVLSLLSASSAFAQQFCSADCNGDCKVNLTDLATMKCQSLSPPYPAPAEKTGQAASWGSGDNGALKTGVAWPNPRFADNLNGTITDNLTGLIWLKNANCAGEVTWADALHDSNVLGQGSCGLTDGSSPGDWRLPTRFELESLLTMAHYDPAIPNTAGTGKWTAGDPFVNVPIEYSWFSSIGYYWSSTTDAFNSENAWLVYMKNGRTYYTSKQYGLSVWPVRGGQSECHADGNSDVNVYSADCNSDFKVDLADLVIMKGEFLRKDCAEHPCLADCNVDNKVDLADLVLMKDQFFTVIVLSPELS